MSDLYTKSDSTNSEGLKTRRIVITNHKSRDNEKAFLITELPVYQAEFWATRAIHGMLQSGVKMEMIEIAAQGSAEALLHLGMNAFFRIEPVLLGQLLKDMMECVKIIPNHTETQNATRSLLPGDIMEVATLLTLRKEIFELHMSFFMEGGPSN